MQVWKTMLSAAAMLAGTGAVTLAPAPALAATYWCNDGVAVSNTKSCKNHGGYTPQTSVHVAAGDVNGDGISDQAAAGNLTSYLRTPRANQPCGPGPVVAPACLVQAGGEGACLKNGGKLADSGAKKFCIPRR